MSAIAIIDTPKEARDLLARAEELALEGQEMFQQHAAAIAAGIVDGSERVPALAANESSRELALCLPRPRLQSPSHLNSTRGSTSSSEAFVRRPGPRGLAPGPLRPSSRNLGPAHRSSISNRLAAGGSRGYHGESCVYPRALLDPSFAGEPSMPRTSRDRGAAGFGMRREGAFYQAGRGQPRSSQARTGLQARPPYHNPIPSLAPDSSIPDWAILVQQQHELHQQALQHQATLPFFQSGGATPDSFLVPSEQASLSNLQDMGYGLPLGSEQAQALQQGFAGQPNLYDTSWLVGAAPQRPPWPYHGWF
eukprot:jgi/Botrbrau1/5921/Bobra.0366s0095.1